MYNKSLKVTPVTEAKLSVILEEERAALAESGQGLEKNEFSDRIVMLGIKAHIEARGVSKDSDTENLAKAVAKEVAELIERVANPEIMFGADFDNSHSPILMSYEKSEDVEKEQAPREIDEQIKEEDNQEGKLF